MRLTAVITALWMILPENAEAARQQYPPNHLTSGKEPEHGARS